MKNATKNSFRNYNALIDGGMRRAHIERSRAFYDLWQQMSSRFTNGKHLSEG
ncbi:MAG: hypothetical protein AAF890_01535 [Pseudomonadota bacterium]